MTDSMKFGPEWLRNMSNDSGGGGGNGGGGGGGGSGGSSTNHSTSSSNSYNSNSMSSSGGGGGSSHPSQSQFQNLSSSHNLNATPGGPPPGVGGGGVHHGGAPGGYMANNITFSNPLGGGGGGLGLASAGPRYQLADYRYGREEMLSLFDKNVPLPEILPRFKKLFVEKIQYPLALTPSTEDEVATESQRAIWPIRSASTSIGIATGRGGVRGGSLERGRGRGRGSYHSTALGFQRSTSMYDEDIRGGVGGGGGAPIRAGTWSERNGLGPDAGGGGSGGGIDWNGSGTSPSKGYTRSNTQESWRKGGRLDEESSSGGSNTSSSLALDGWRGGGGGGGSLTGGSSGFVKWSRSQSWRDEDGDNPAGNPSSSASRYMNMMSMGGDRGASERGLGLNSPAAKAAAMHARKLTPWEDDNLPEWAIEDPIEGGGSFDASGAFHGTEDGTAPGKASAKDDGGSGGSGSETDAKSDRKHSSTETSDADAPTTADSDPTVASSTPTPPNSSSSSASTTSSSSTSPSLSTPTDHPARTPADPSTARPPTLPGKSASPSPTMSIPASEAQAPKADAAPVVAASPAKSAAAATVVAATSAAKPTQSPVTNHADSVDRMKAQADDMVKKLVMDDEFAASPSPHSQRAKSQDMYQMSLHNQLQLQPNPAAALSAVGTGPPEQRNNNLWFYRDPQGTVQGAFPAAEMSEWYRAGYFDENLLVRRQGDTTYAALGDLVRICNGIPFIYTHFIPPLESLDIAVLLEGIAAGHPPAFMLHVAALGIGSVTPQQSPAPGPLTVPTVPPGGPTVGPSPTQADLLQMNFHLHMLQKQFFIRQHGMVLQKLAASESWHLMTAEQQSNLISQHMAQIPIPEHLLPGAAAAGIGVPAGPVGLVVGPGGGPSPSGGIAAQVGGPKPVQQQQQQQKNTSNRPGGGPPHPLYASHHLHDPAVLAAANNDTSAMQHLLHQLNHQPQLPLPIPMPPSASTSSSSLSSVTQSSGSTNPIKSLMLQLSMQKGGAGAANAGGGPANAADKQPIVGWMGTTGVAGGQPPKLDQTNVWDMALIGGGGGKSMHPEMKTESQILEEQMSQQHQHQQHMQLQMQQHQQQQQHLQQLQYQQLMAAHEREHAQVQQLQHMRHFEGNNNNSSNAFDSQQQRHFPNAAAAAAAAAAGRHPIMAHNNTSGAKDGPEINEENDIMSDLWMQQQQHHHSHQQQQLHIQQQQQQNLQQQQQQPPQQPQPGDMSAAAKQRADKKAANDDKKKLLGEDTEKWSSVGNGRKKDQSPRVGPNDSPAAKKSGGGVVQQQIGASTPQDDKKRAKELKRLQIEEERRRAQEEEKRRQIAEEKKRLEDISEQRRLKLMDVARTSSSGTTQSLAAALGVTQKPNSAGSAPSIAPWLGASQPTQTAQPQVSLADIQKAERERRAEQFRVDQLMREQQHNQMQMAAAEQKENALKWNLKPHSVKSLAEIQAEEAKRQAVLERERQHNIMMANAAAAIGPSSVLVGKKSSDSLVGGAGGVGVGGGSLSLGLASAMGAAAGASQGSGFSSGFSSIWNNSTANTSLWNTSKPMWGTNGPGVAAQMSQPPPQLHQQQQQQHGHTVAAALAAAHSQHHQQQQHQHQQSQSMSHLGGGFWEEPPSAPTGFAGVTAAQSLSSAAATKSVTIRSTVGLSATTATPPKTLVKSQTVSNMQQAAAKSSAKQQQQNQAKPLTKASSSANVSAGGGSVSAKPNKKKAAGDESGSSHEFTAWCCKALSAHADIVDVPTFVAFLRDIESPFEVKDYIRMYLGETKDCLEFARQYLERRSKYKNQLRAANAHIDDMCQPAPAITPSHGNDFQEVKGKAKKEKKKNKMVKLDTRILGFSVTAAQDRLNVGDRDYGDAP